MRLGASATGQKFHNIKKATVIRFFLIFLRGNPYNGSIDRRFVDLRMSPPPSSKGGLSPGLVPGLFFILARIWVLFVFPIDSDMKNPLKSSAFRIQARGKEQGEPAHAPGVPRAHSYISRIAGQQAFNFWIDHEDVFRKSP
jgi:hypothetical protein